MAAGTSSTAAPRSTLWPLLAYMFITVHLIISFVVIIKTVGSMPDRIGGVLVTPALQWGNGVFTCLVIMSIIAAGVGNLYLIESHLMIYFWVLVTSVLVDIGWIVYFAVGGYTCLGMPQFSTLTEEQAACKFTSGWLIALIVGLLLFKAVGALIISRAQKFVRIQYNAELLPHLKRSLNRSHNSEEAGESGPGNYGTIDFAPSMMSGMGIPIVASPMAPTPLPTPATPGSPLMMTAGGPMMQPVMTVAAPAPMMQPMMSAGSLGPQMPMMLVPVAAPGPQMQSVMLVGSPPMTTVPMAPPAVPSTILPTIPVPGSAVAGGNGAPSTAGTVPAAATAPVEAMG